MRYPIQGRKSLNPKNPQSPKIKIPNPRHKNPKIFKNLTSPGIKIPRFEKIPNVRDKNPKSPGYNPRAQFTKFLTGDFWGSIQFFDLACNGKSPGIWD